MTYDIYQSAIEEAKFRVAKISCSFHNFVHVESVVVTASQLSDRLDADTFFIETAAWWHDVGRAYCSDDHERSSAEQASSYLDLLGCDEKTCIRMYDAIAYHKWNMSPETIEGKIVRDADKLDLINPARWIEATADRNLEHIEDVITLLPKLRDRILELEQARNVYDARIPFFHHYVRRILEPEILLETRDCEALRAFIGNEK